MNTKNKNKEIQEDTVEIMSECGDHRECCITSPDCRAKWTLSGTKWTYRCGC